MAANPKETTAIIRENAADHALRPLFMRFEWTRCIRHFQLSMRYDIGYTRNFNRFLGGISRLSNIVGDNPILLVPVHDQMCLITFVPCFISSSEGI